MSGPIRMGIAGLGRAGWSLHAATLAKVPGYEVTSVHDPIAERMTEASAQFGCVGHRSYLDLVRSDDLDVVVVATPSASHAELAVEALRHGKHVLVEKPFATSLAEAEQMISAATAAQRLLLPSHNLRYSRTFLTLRDVLDSGRLGTILEARTHWHAYKRRWDWQTIPALGGGALNNDGSHVVDQVLALFGDYEPDVFCRSYATPLSAGGAEDHVKVVVTVAGTIVDIELSNACAYPQPKWLIMGVNGSLVADASAVRWRYVDPAALAGRTATAAPTPDRSYNMEDLPWTEHEVGLADEAYVDSHRRMYEALAPVLRGTQPPPIPLTNIRSQLTLLDHCRSAMHAQLGGENWMKLAYSTLAAPGWTWQHAVEQATVLGYDGIEWRLVDGRMVDADFPTELARQIAAATRAAGLGVPALDSSIQLTAAPGADGDRVLADTRAMLRLAAAFGAEYLRVFAGTYPETVSDQDARDWTREAVVALAPDARDAGVRIALELHDCGWDRAGIRGVTSSAFLAGVLNGLDVPEAGLQWDLGNPFLEGEPPLQTWEHVRPFLTYLQLKDMQRTDDGWRYVPIGAGEVPIGDIIEWVTASGFTGWASFEWEKWWHPELAEADAVLPGFVAYMAKFRS